MHQFQIVYLAPTPSGTLIERGLIESDNVDRQGMASSLHQQCGFLNSLTNKFVCWGAILEIDQLN